MSEHDHILAHARATLATTAARYRTEIRAGHHDIIADEGPGGGGLDAGANPFALVMSGLGACTAITLRMYAERKGWSYTEIAVDLTCWRDTDKSVKVDRVLTIGGMDAEQKARMAEIAEKTPVTLALRAGMGITTTVAA
jgi:putative redox protein